VLGGEAVEQAADDVLDAQEAGDEAGVLGEVVGHSFT
jgi:hypothetical protein